VGEATQTQICHVEMHKFVRTLNFQMGLAKVFNNVVLFKRTLKKMILQIDEADRVFVIDNKTKLKGDSGYITQMGWNKQAIQDQVIEMWNVNESCGLSFNECKDEQ